jgi:hypothetical protein
MTNIIISSLHPSLIMTIEAYRPLLGPGKLDKELIEWILQRVPHTVHNDKESQTPVKEEASEWESLICDMQDQSPPETTDKTTRKRSCSPSSSSTNNVGIPLKGASAPSKVEKKTPKKSRAVLKASKKANLGSAGSRTPSNGSEIMLDLNLPTSAIGAVTSVFVCGIEEEAVTLIQSMYKPPSAISWTLLMHRRSRQQAEVLSVLE